MLRGRAKSRLQFESVTTTNVHGCWLAPDGAVPAARIAFSISSRGTGSARTLATLLQEQHSPDDVDCQSLYPRLPSANMAVFQGITT